ncbi:MAG: hypothetical protein ACJAUH_003309, partial [Saprospiraceae bacterium]
MNLKLLLSFLLLSNIILAQNDTYHDTLISQLQSIYGLTGGTWILTPNESTNATNAISYGQTTTQTTTVGQDFSIGINLNIANTGANPWDAGYSNSNINSIQNGDKVLAIIWIKTISTPIGGQSGKVNVFVEDAVTYNKEFFITATPTFQWQQYLIPFEASGSYTPGSLNFG